MGDKIAVLIYPGFSMQEISCLTDALALWYQKEVDVFASSNNLIKTEDGFQIAANKTLDEFTADDYECLIMPGTVNPLLALFDEEVIRFLQGLKGRDIIIAGISCSPLLLAKAGLLADVKYTGGMWDEFSRVFDFIPCENNLHQPVVRDRNIITAIGFAFREFAIETIRALGLSCEDHLFAPVKREYTREELTFKMGEDNFTEFLEEFKQYQV